LVSIVRDGNFAAMSMMIDMEIVPISFDERVCYFAPSMIPEYNLYAPNYAKKLLVLIMLLRS
jgi:hypothetical protein